MAERVVPETIGPGTAPCPAYPVPAFYPRGRAVDDRQAESHATARQAACPRSHDQPVSLLAAKLLLAPSFVVGASLAARRFGPRVGGLIGGLPVVAGPILLAYALAHGRSFAAGAG